MTNVFWIIAAVVVVGLIAYYFLQKKPAGPTQKGPTIPPSETPPTETP
jgi:hypothetical protein